MEIPFREMLSPSEAEAILAETLPRFPSVLMPLARCQGRFLAEPIRADRAQPPFDRVAMDGIAFAYSAWQSGLRRFAVQGVQKAGDKPKTLASPDRCLEAMTGAVLPSGADCIAPVEDIHIADGYATLSDSAAASVAPYRHVHRAGGDCSAGAEIVAAGACLSSPHLGAAAAFGYTELSVGETPSVAVIATGDELVDPGREPLAFQIRRSNPHAIQAALRARRIDRVALLHSRDEPDRLRRCLEGVLGKCQVLILTGGVSMGQTDHVPRVLRDLGIKPMFHRIRQKPGKPFWFGMGAGGLPVFALPGNPASVLVCLHRYVLPALERAMGAGAGEALWARLDQTAPAPGKLTQFRPVTLRSGMDGCLRAAWVENQGSGDFSGWARSDGFAELPPAEMGGEPNRMSEAGQGSGPASVVRIWRW